MKCGAGNPEKRVKMLMISLSENPVWRKSAVNFVMWKLKLMRRSHLFRQQSHISTLLSSRIFCWWTHFWLWNVFTAKLQKRYFGPFFWLSLVSHRSVSEWRDLFWDTGLISWWHALYSLHLQSFTELMSLRNLKRAVSLRLKWWFVLILNSF